MGQVKVAPSYTTVGVNVGRPVNSDESSPKVTILVLVELGYTVRYVITVAVKLRVAVVSVENVNAIGKITS